MTFEEILKKGIENRHLPAQNQRSRIWYRSRAAAVQNPSLDINQPSRKRDKVEIGSMYMYHYDPKTKDKLPFYDTFPTIFVVGPAEGGFYGLNLHYLPYQMRAKLMDALNKYASDKRYDEKTKLNLSYELLKSVSKLKYFQPCFKRYLTSHVRSNMMYIFPYEWDIAMFLPIAQFQKKTQEQVWENSKARFRPAHMRKRK